MAAQLQLQGVSIVLRGHFNPAIFHPSWFSSHNLIRTQEADAAEVLIVHPDTAVFKAEWLELNITRDRFQAITTQEAYYEPLRDLVSGVLDLLSHTPLKAMGLNRDFHFRMESVRARDSLGHRLAPKSDWESLLKEPVLTNLTVAGKRTDGLQGYTSIQVAPSILVENGVYIQVNDHYQLASGEQALPKASEAREILATLWSASMKRGLGIAQTIANLEKAE